jgi:small subunit ribosomal protein S11
LTELSKMRFGTNFIESALSLSGDPDRQALEKAMNAKSEPFHLHIYSHKKNTHITLTRPNNDVVISVSNGNLGFKHSKRKHYDAAYQLMQHMVSLIEKKGLLPHIPNIEVILKGFGQGREAAAKVLLSPEGVEIKKKIVRVADATTLKFGGTRSRNPRRI